MTDIPSVLFVEELMAAYPDAKILVTTRGMDGWLKSMHASFYEILGWKRWTFLQAIDWVSYYDIRTYHLTVLTIHAQATHLSLHPNSQGFTLSMD